jgi:hypothetical protein
MLLTELEWHLRVLCNHANEPVASWKRAVISYDATPFLLHDPEIRVNDNPSSIVIPSVEELVEELERPPGRSLENVSLQILSPGTGTEPVFELWTYQSGHDETVYYAYAGRDDTLLPCNREQPQTMMGLRRRFTLGGRGPVVGDRLTKPCGDVAQFPPDQQSPSSMAAPPSASPDATSSDGKALAA